MQQQSFQSAFQRFLGIQQQQKKELPTQTLQELKIADNFFDTKDFKNAEKAYRKIANVFRKYYGKTDPRTIEIYYKLAKSLQELFRYEAIDFYKIILDNSDPNSDMYKLSLAHTFFLKKEMEKALEIYQPLLTKYTEKYGPDDDRTMEIYNYTARAVYANKDLQKAQQMYKKISQYRQKIKGQTDDHTLKAFHTLAYIYLLANKVDKALPLIEKLLKYADHNLLSAVSSSLSLIEPEELLVPYLEQAFQYRSKTLGSEHRITTDILERLIKTLISMEDYQKALELYEPLPKEIKEDLYINFPFNLKTLQYHKKKLQQTKKQYGQQSTRTLDAVRIFAERLVKIGLDQQALSYFEWVLQRETDPDTRSQIQQSYNSAKTMNQNSLRNKQEAPKHRANLLINNYISGQLSQQKFKSTPEITKQILESYLKTTAQTKQQLLQKLAILKQERVLKIKQQAALQSMAQQTQRAKKSKQSFTQQQLGQIKVMDYIMYDQVPIKDFLQQPNSIVIANKQPSGTYEFHGFLLDEPNMVYTCAELSNQEYLMQKDGLTIPLVTLKTDVEFRIPRDELLPKLKEGYNVFFVETSPEKVKIISKDIVLGGEYVSGVHCTDKDVFNITHIIDSKNVGGMFVWNIDLSYYQKKV